MNQLANPHIPSLGETSPAATWCSLTDSSPPSMASGMPFTPLLHPCCRLATCGAIPDVSLTTDDKQAKEKKKRGEINVVTDQRSRPRRTVFPLEKKPEDNCPIPPYFQAPCPDTPVPGAPQRTALPAAPAQAGVRKEAP